MHKLLINYISQLLAIITLITASHSYAAPDLRQSNSSSMIKIFSLQDLIAQDGFSLMGMGASRELYLPVLTNWDIDHIQLHLKLTANIDPSSHNKATITALIKDYPISSININKSNMAPLTWDITIPAKYITGGLVTLKLQRNWDENDVRCNNFSDPSNWVTVSADSTISYQVKERSFQPNLSLFPIPFINDPSIQKDSTLFLLPDNITTNDLESSYYVATALLHKQTWRGISLSGNRARDISDEVKSKSNIILIGEAKRIKDMPGHGTWPLKLNNQGLLIDKNNKIIPDETGVILLTPSPWNNHFAMLVVTGNNANSVSKAAKAINSKKFEHSVLFNEYAFITEDPEQSVDQISWGNTSLKELGYKDIVVYGTGENSIKYELNLPYDKTPTGMDISLKYSNSPLLSGRDSSFLAVKMNDLPISGIRISSNDANIKTWNIHINGENLMPGLNQLKFTFNLKFYNKNCTPEDLSLAWGTIYSNTEIETSFEKNNRDLSFNDFSSMQKNLSVFIPDSEKIFSASELIGLTFNLARDIKHVDNLNIYFDDMDISSLAKNSNIIYIGNLSYNTELSKLIHDFPFRYLNNKIIIKQSLLPYVHVSDETPVALVELIKSPYNNNQQLLLITADGLDGYKKAVDTFFNPKKRQYLRGNVALSYKNGTFTSIDTNRLERKASNKHLIDTYKRNVLIGFVTFIIIFFGGIIMLIMVRRIQKYFSKNSS